MWILAQRGRNNEESPLLCGSHCLFPKFPLTFTGCILTNTAKHTTLRFSQKPMCCWGDQLSTQERGGCEKMCVQTPIGQAFPNANSAPVSSFCNMSIWNLARVKGVHILMHSNRLYCSSVCSLSVSLFCTSHGMWCILQAQNYFSLLHHWGTSS